MQLVFIDRLVLQRWDHILCFSLLQTLKLAIFLLWRPLHCIIRRKNIQTIYFIEFGLTFIQGYGRFLELREDIRILDGFTDLIDFILQTY